MKMAPFDEIHAIMAESEEYCGMMIINWYSTHIDLSDLSQRLRIAYALWIASSSPGKLPHLKQIELSHEYEKISPYVALVENQGSAEQPKLTFLTAGLKKNPKQKKLINKRK